MRKDSFKALVGSHNYNLNTPESDKDYKIFFYPSFDDLYSGEKYSKSKTSDTEDIEYHDIRKLPDMLWKSNVNFLEVLFSTDVDSYDDLYKELRSRREEIASMNLPYLYDACIGMYYKKYKDAERSLVKTDLKKARKDIMSAYRILDFLVRYSNNQFSSFENAIRYEDDEPVRKFLFEIRNGLADNMLNKLEIKLNLTEELKPTYKSVAENSEIKEWLYKTVKWEVEENIFMELQ